MTLSSTTALRRGSTPLPIKHQLRRDECASHVSLSPRPFSLCPTEEEEEEEGQQGATLRVALLGQAGVGKSSLAVSLTGQGDRTASVDSEGEGYTQTVTVDDEESKVFIYDNWRQDLSALQCEVCVLVFSVTDRRSFHRTAQLRLLLRDTQPHTPIILVGNKSDLVRTREVSSEEAECSASLFDCRYLELSASLEHGTSELLQWIVRAARGDNMQHQEGVCDGQRESVTSKAKRFLSSLVPARHKDRGRFLRQKSHSCHDLGAL